jgi:hypothetical protein
MPAWTRQRRRRNRRLARPVISFDIKRPSMTFTFRRLRIQKDGTPTVRPGAFLHTEAFPSTDLAKLTTTRLRGQNTANFRIARDPTATRLSNRDALLMAAAASSLSTVR